jgi:outer membrane translocation and assembly module TamA
VDDFDVGEVRPAVGVGVRFKSPVGPIRADLGVKLQPQTFADGSREQRTAFYISIGQAF